MAQQRTLVCMAAMVGMRLSARCSLYLQEASLFLEMASWS
jgi:hypothetical protein